MLDRSRPPQAKPIQALSLLTPQHHTIQPQLPLFLFQDTTQEVSQLSLILQKAPLHTPLDHALPPFVASLLTEGTQTQTKSEVAAYIDQYGASLHAHTTQDTLEIHLLTLPQHFHHLLPLLTEILTAPAFSQEALTLAQKITTQDIHLREATPQSLAKKWLRRQIFGPHHPYGYSIEEEDLPSITSETLHQAFRHHIIQPGCCVLSGHIEPAMVEATQTALSHLPPRHTSEHTYTPVPSSKPIYFQKDHAVQTSLALGMSTVTRTHPDYPLFHILNTLLGGYFGARLMQNIREDKGYTYGIGSQLKPYLHQGFFCITTEVKKGCEEATLQEIHREIETLRTTLVSEEELKTLKNFLRGRLMAAFDNVFSLAHHFAHLHIHGMDFDHYKQLYTTLQHVQPKALQKTAQKYLSMSRLARVIVRPSL